MAIRFNKPAGSRSYESPEFIEQSRFIRWLEIQWRAVLFCASAGGMATTKASAGRMKAAGYRKGHPDVTIYESSGGYKCLFIEFKAAGGSPADVSDEQRTWIRQLTARGFLAVAAYGLEDAVLITNAYFKGRQDIDRLLLARPEFTTFPPRIKRKKKTPGLVPA